jgi:hypothetical protein
MYVVKIVILSEVSCDVAMWHGSFNGIHNTFMHFHIDECYEQAN